MPGQVCKEEECGHKGLAIIEILLKYNSVMNDDERADAIKIEESLIEKGQGLIDRVRDRVDG
jgi:hypothetical protein